MVTSWKWHSWKPTPDVRPSAGATEAVGPEHWARAGSRAHNSWSLGVIHPKDIGVPTMCQGPCVHAAVMAGYP